MQAKQRAAKRRSGKPAAMVMVHMIVMLALMMMTWRLTLRAMVTTLMSMGHQGVEVCV